MWLTRIIVEMIHQEQLKEHGGAFGIRGENAFETALARPQHKHHYESPDLAALAAAYAFALTTSHAFNDGNKRTAYVTAAVFLELNAYDLDLEGEELERTMVGMATGDCTEEQLAAVFRDHMKPMPSDETKADD